MYKVAIGLKIGTHVIFSNRFFIGAIPYGIGDSYMINIPGMDS